jgi:hypothetical protein
MRFGRSAIQSNVIAVFMSQQHRAIPNKKAAGIYALRPTGLKIHQFQKRSIRLPRCFNTEPSLFPCEVKNVVPVEEHNECCRTETWERRALLLSLFSKDPMALGLQ